MTQISEFSGHPPHASASRPTTPASRLSTESYVEHLRNDWRLSFDSDVFEVFSESPASLSPPPTPRPASPAHLHHQGHQHQHQQHHHQYYPDPGPYQTVREPYRSAEAMMVYPPTPMRRSGQSTPAITLSPPPSRPLTPASPASPPPPPLSPPLPSPSSPAWTPAATTPFKPYDRAISPHTRPVPRRSYEPDPFEHRTRWVVTGPGGRGNSGYCFGLCEEPPLALAMCGSWLTGTATAFLAGASMACCAAALR